MVCPSSNFLSETQPRQAPSCSHEDDAATKHHHTAEYLEMHVSPSFFRHQGSSDRVAHQSSHTDDGKHTSSADTNLANVGYLGDKGWCQGDERSAAEAVECCEQNVGHVTAGGQPKAKHKDGTEE